MRDDAAHLVDHLVDPRTGRRLDPLAMIVPANLYDPAFQWAVDLGAVPGTAAGVVDLEGYTPDQSGPAGLPPCAFAELTIVRQTAAAGQAAGHLPLGPPQATHAHASDPLELAELLEAITTPCTCGHDGCPGEPLVPAEEAAAHRTALDKAIDGVLVVVRLALIPNVFTSAPLAPPPMATGPASRPPIVTRRT